MNPDNPFDWPDDTPAPVAQPLDTFHENLIRKYVAAAKAEVGAFAPGGTFEMLDQVLATLDAARSDSCRHDAKWIAEFTDWVIRAHEARSVPDNAALRALLSSSASDDWNAGVQAAIDVLAGTPWEVALAAAPASPAGLDEEHCCNDPSHMSPEYLAALPGEASR